MRDGEFNSPAYPLLDNISAPDRLPKCIEDCAKIPLRKSIFVHKTYGFVQYSEKLLTKVFRCCIFVSESKNHNL